MLTRTQLRDFQTHLFHKILYEQLLGAVEAVFSSWLNNRAVTYRKINNIPDTWGTGAQQSRQWFLEI